MYAKAKSVFVVVTTLALATPSAAIAQAVIINGDTSGGPTFDRPDESPTLYGCSCRYQADLITITNSGAFVAEITHGAPVDFDTYLILYQGAFDPTDPLTNLVAENDDTSTILSLISSAAHGPFPTGQYTIVVTGYDGGYEGSYTLTMNGVVLGWGTVGGGVATDTLYELKAVLAQTGRSTLRVIDGGVSAAAQESIAARGLVLSTKGQMGWTSSNMRAWTKGSATRGNGGGRAFADSVFQFGADIEVSTSMVVGLSFGLGTKSANSTSFTFAGDQKFIQPYVGWRSGTWKGSASLTYGKINYGTITTSSGSAGAKGDLMAVTANISRDFAISPDTTLAPFGSLRIGQSKLTATSGSLAGIGVTDLTTFNELSLGAKLTQQMGSSALTVGVSIDRFDTNAPTGLVGGTFDQTGVSGSVSLGYSAKIGGGWDLVSGLKISGIGTNTTSYSGSLRVGIRF